MKITEKEIKLYIESQIEDNKKIKIDSISKTISKEKEKTISVFYSKFDDNSSVEEDVVGFKVLSKAISFSIIDEKDILKFIRKQKINKITNENN